MILIHKRLYPGISSTMPQNYTNNSNAFHNRKSLVIHYFVDFFNFNNCTPIILGKNDTNIALILRIKLHGW